MSRREAHTRRVVRGSGAVKGAAGDMVEGQDSARQRGPFSFRQRTRERREVLCFL